MDARCRAAEERRAVECVVDTLLVHRVAAFVQRREEPIGEIVVAIPRGDAYVAETELGHERVRGLVLAPAVEVVAERADDLFAERALLVLREIAGQAAVVQLRARANRLDQRHEAGAQFGEERAHLRHGHAVLGVIDERVVRVRVARIEAGELATQLHGLLEIGSHRGEVVGGPGTLPHVVGGGRVLAQTLDELVRHANRSLVVAPRHANQRRGVRVGTLRFGPRRQRIEQSADRGIGHPFVHDAAQERDLATACNGSAGRHVGHLVPTQHGFRAVQVVDRLQALLEIGERYFGIHRVGLVRFPDAGSPPVVVFDRRWRCLAQGWPRF